MKHHIKYSLIIALFFYACTKDTNLQPTSVSIYMNNDSTSSNVLAIDVKTTDDNGLLIFGVKGGSSSKFDGDGQLYLQKVDEKGNFVWDTFYNMQSGFLANVVNNDNGYIVFWNTNADSFYSINITGDFIDEPQINSTQLDISDSTSLRYILKADKTIDGDYLILGIATYDIPNQSNTPYKRVQLVKIDQQLNFKQTLGEQGYDPLSFGTIGYEDLAMMKKLNNFFHILNGENIYITAPEASNISLKHIGNPEAIYSDKKFWIAAANISDNNTISFVINNQTEESIFYVPNLQLHSNNLNFNNLQKTYNTQFDTQADKLVNIDVDTKISILKTSENNTIIAATTNGGEVVLYLFDSNGELLNAKNKNNPVIIGKGYRYETVKLIETFDDENIAIVGFTKVEYKYQRIFLILIPKNELF